MNLSLDQNIWSFLTTWHTFSIEEKHDRYNKNACHELNLFIYFKDPSYFETYIKDFLKNKLEKTFVDFFLLRIEKQL